MKNEFRFVEGVRFGSKIELVIGHFQTKHKKKVVRFECHRTSENEIQTEFVKKQRNLILRF